MPLLVDTQFRDSACKPLGPKDDWFGPILDNSTSTEGFKFLEEGVLTCPIMQGVENEATPFPLDSVIDHHGPLEREPLEKYYVYVNQLYHKY